jgi:hypothetical protein
MITRILLFIAIVFCPAAWSAQAYVHGAHGALFGEFQLHVVLDPATVGAGETVRLDLTMTDPEGADVTELEPGADLEVTLVRQGLDVFSVLRPDMRDGVMSMNLKFPAAGDYHVYVGFTPLSGEPVTVMSGLTIAGEAPAAPPLEVHVPGRILTETFGADIALETTPLGTNIGLSLISPDGEPLTDVDTASGDLILVSEDGTEFFHAVPAGGASANEATFGAVFPRPGIYKAWARFQGAGGLLELPFALEVSGF